MGRWLRELVGDPDEKFLSDGLKYGFELIPRDSHFRPAEMHNYLSATGTAVRDKVEQTLLDEIALGNYVISETKPTIVSALGAVPKPDSEDVQLIHDCSQPEGSAVNNYADTESFKYQTLEDAVKLLKPGYYMAKIDLHHAYRSVSIHPSNYKATGLKWKFKSNPHKVTYLIDTRLPYGGKRAPEIFHRLTQSVRRMMAKKGFRALVVYLDDFLIVGATYAECLEAFNYLLELLQDLGFEISWHKVVSPTQVLIFLGVELNTVSQTMSLPQHKLVELQAFVLGFAQRRRASKRQLQVLAGKLSWASRVVYGGRTFLRRILDVMNGLKSPGAKFLLTDDFYADLAWWSDFLAAFNGKCLFLDRVPLTTVQTDACYEAAGAFYNGDWLYYNFSIESFLLSDLHINYKEVLAVVLAAERWAPLWANKHVIIKCDNQAAVGILNKGTTKNGFIMNLLRSLFWLSAKFNFRITAQFIEGKKNVIADALSRMHVAFYLLRAFHYLCSQSTLWQVNSEFLMCHMPYASFLFLLSRYSGYKPGC